MMKKTLNLSTLTVALIVVSASIGHAITMVYTDRTAWETALGAPIFTENFDGLLDKEIFLRSLQVRCTGGFAAWSGPSRQRGRPDRLGVINPHRNAHGLTGHLREKSFNP